MGGANSEAVFWIQKRAQERDAKINDIVDKLNKQIEKTFTAVGFPDLYGNVE